MKTPKDEKTKLVWSDDPKDKIKMAAEANPQVSEASDDSIKALGWVAVFRLETAKRGGRTVTVIDKLPRQDKFIRDLCKELKAKCGTGGTYELNNDSGVIEIQGDKRSEIKAIFTKRGYKFKGM